MAVAEPLVLPMVMVPEPKDPATEPDRVPASMVAAALLLVATVSAKAEPEELFSITLVTLLPMGPVMLVLPVPVPLLVMVPVLLMELPESVMPPAVELLLLRIRLPAPDIVPDTVNRDVPKVLIRVVPLLFGASEKVILSAEVVLSWLIEVTLLPT